MIEKELLAYLKYAHGLYNTTVMLLFFHQGWVGMTIRRQRLGEGDVSLTSRKRHRRTGPVLALMGVLGFIAGLTLVMVDEGNLLKYPLHLFVGSAIILLIVATYRVSRHIKGLDAPFRTPHFILGVTLLVLYLIEVFLGLGIVL